MSLRTPSKPISAFERRAAAFLMAASGIVWLELLMRARWSAEAFGPICAHSGAFALHCPSCYAATAMIAAGVVIAIQTMTRAVAPARAAAPSRTR